jgi:hypothetical protein
MWWLGIRSSAEFTALHGVGHPVSVAVEASKNPAFPRATMPSLALPCPIGLASGMPPNDE